MSQGSFNRLHLFFFVKQGDRHVYNTHLFITNIQIEEKQGLITCDPNLLYAQWRRLQPFFDTLNANGCM